MPGDCRKSQQDQSILSFLLTWSDYILKEELAKSFKETSIQKLKIKINWSNQLA